MAEVAREHGWHPPKKFGLYYMVYIAYFTELILQICDYAQKRHTWRENCKYTLDENFHCHFCSRRKAAKFCHPGDCPQWTSIFPSCCLGSLLNRNWSKPWIAQYIAIHSGMSFTVKRLLRTAPKWHTSYLYLSPKIKLFHSKIFYFFSFSLFFSSVAVLFFCRRIYLGCLLAPEVLQ